MRSGISQLLLRYYRNVDLLRSAVDTGHVHAALVTGGTIQD